MPKKFREINKECLNCGRFLKLNNSRDIIRKNFCCRRCSTLYYLNKGEIGMAGKHHSEEAKIKMADKAKINFKGEGNPRYTHGIHMYRNLALNQSSECSFCKSNEKLQVHHIDGNRLNNQLNNLVVLCSYCHRYIHLRRGEQFLKN